MHHGGQCRGRTFGQGVAQPCGAVRGQRGDKLFREWLALIRPAGFATRSLGLPILGADESALDAHFSVIAKANEHARDGDVFGAVLLNSGQGLDFSFEGL